MLLPLLLSATWGVSALAVADPVVARLIRVLRTEQAPRARLAALERLTAMKARAGSAGRVLVETACFDPAPALRERAVSALAAVQPTVHALYRRIEADDARTDVQKRRQAFLAAGPVANAVVPALQLATFVRLRQAGYLKQLEALQQMWAVTTANNMNPIWEKIAEQGDRHASKVERLEELFFAIRQDLAILGEVADAWDQALVGFLYEVARLPADPAMVAAPTARLTPARTYLEALQHLRRDALQTVLVLAQRVPGLRSLAASRLRWPIDEGDPTCRELYARIAGLGGSSSRTHLATLCRMARADTAPSVRQVAQDAVTAIEAALKPNRPSK